MAHGDVIARGGKAAFRQGTVAFFCDIAHRHAERGAGWLGGRLAGGSTLAAAATAGVVVTAGAAVALWAARSRAS